MTNRSKEYRVKTFFDDKTKKCSAFHWYNQLGQKDAPGDYPSKVLFSKSGHVWQAHWYFQDKPHRDNEYPSVLYFNENTGKLVGAAWYNQGLESRENGFPSYISIHENTGLVSCLEFKLHGEYYRPEEKHSHIDFDPNGTAYDVDGNIIEVTKEDYQTDWLAIIPQQALLDHKHFSSYCLT